MAPTRTRTVKNKHAASKSSSSGGGGGVKKSSTDGGISKSKLQRPKGVPSASVSKQVKEKNATELLKARQKKNKKKVYTAEELGIPSLNMITPVGVVKPKGKKKGKIFVDDKESMNTIMSMVQAEKKGQIESKMIKARQMEEIREARKAEMEQKETDKKSKMEDAKAALRKKRKRKSTQDQDDSSKEASMAGTKAKKPRKRVSFA